MQNLEFDDIVIRDNDANMSLMQQVCLDERLMRIYSRWPFINRLGDLLRTCGFKIRIKAHNNIQVTGWVGEDQDVDTVKQIIAQFE